MLHILIGLTGCKLQNKVEMTVMLASVRQIRLWIEELQTFNMVSGIDLRHLALWPVYYLASVSPFIPLLRSFCGDGVLISPRLSSQQLCSH